MIEFTRRKPLIVFLVACLGLAGCTTNVVPTPTVVVPTPTVVKTPQVNAKMGALVATLVYSSDGQPSRRQTFYVTPLNPVVGADGTPVGLLGGLDPTTAQRDDSDGAGTIVISQIPPGQYGLSMATPRGYILLKESPSHKEIVFDITAGQVTDLGKRNIEVDKTLVEP